MMMTHKVDDARDDADAEEVLASYGAAAPDVSFMRGSLTLNLYDLGASCVIPDVLRGAHRVRLAGE
jgi:hypothetical protein